MVPPAGPSDESPDSTNLSPPQGSPPKAPLLLVSLSSWVGFLAGAVAAGQTGLAIMGAITGAFSLCVGVLWVAPKAARDGGDRAEARIWYGLTSNDPKYQALRRATMAGLITETVWLADNRGDILAPLVDRFADRYVGRVRGAFGAEKQKIMREYAEGGEDDDLDQLKEMGDKYLPDGLVKDAVFFVAKREKKRQIREAVGDRGAGTWVRP